MTTSRVGKGAPMAAGAADLLVSAFARWAEGFARRCHGDLHLGNILLEHGQPILFDCIEFNDRLSEIDTLYDESDVAPGP